MKTNFEIDNSIALVSGDEYFDLHNHYDFVSFEYLVEERIVRLGWRVIGTWSREEIDAGYTLTKYVTLFFIGVSGLAMQKQWDTVPFSENMRLAHISFLWPSLEENFETLIFDRHSSGPDDHFSLGLNSGAGIKVWAEEAILRTDETQPPIKPGLTQP